MEKPINKTCCGGDYTETADPVNPNAHQGSPVKRHNTENKQTFLSTAERQKLAVYIAAYCQYEHDEHAERFEDTTPEIMIVDAINAFASIEHNE